MGRGGCFVKEGEKKGAWSSEEDELLIQFVKLQGEGKWRTLAEKAGLKRSGKSCRLRWLNYLRPGIKRGDFTWDEDELIVKLHKLLGNRWALIAGRLPGRTDNEIKNYWNTILCKRVQKSSGLSSIPKLESEENKSDVLQRYSSDEELQDDIPGESKEENLQTEAAENCNAGFDSTNFSIQIHDQENYNSLVFNFNENMISADHHHTLNFDTTTCNIPPVSCNDPENHEDQKLDPLQDMELRKIASLLDIENEFRGLL